MILVTGATGNVGTEVVKKLAEGKHPTRAFVRNRTQAREIAQPGVEIVEGDFTKPKTFAKAMEGVDSLFLLTRSSEHAEEQQCNLVDTARRSGVKHIVKLSQMGADEDAPGRFRQYHGAVEGYIVKSKIPYTFLRPNLFMQGLLNFRPTIASQGVFFAPVSNARISAIDVRDIGRVAARTLTQPNHQNKTYELTGPESLTHAEMAEQLSQAVGKPIRHIEVSDEIMRDALLKSGVPEWQAEGIVEDYKPYRRGEGEQVTSTVQDLSGYEPTWFSQFALDYGGHFATKAAGRA